MERSSTAPTARPPPPPIASVGKQCGGGIEAMRGAAAVIAHTDAETRAESSDAGDSDAVAAEATRTVL